MPPISLYIHIPWCIRKCPYCDFNSHPKEHSYDENRYTNSLIKDIQFSSLFLENKTIESIFFGGGTPSLFGPESFNRVLEALKAITSFSEEIEITIEANPGTFEKEKFYEFKEVGINRLSIGVQSYDDYFLGKLGRVHNARDAIKAVEHAMEIGFQQVNTDIMYALPRQSSKESLRELKNAIAIAPDHMSWYQLTLEPNTYFYNNPPSLPDEDLIGLMHEQGVELLQQQGYQQYEISAYTKTKPCKHNMNYWQFGDYLGIGAGAHGKLTQQSPFAINRTTKAKHPKDFIEQMEKHQAQKQSSISTVDKVIFEYMLNALRLNQGTTFSNFESTTGVSIEQLTIASQPSLEKELISLDNEIITSTTLGRKFLNDTLETFLAD